jgi:hypothetical protein
MPDKNKCQTVDAEREVLLLLATLRRRKLCRLFCTLMYCSIFVHRHRVLPAKVAAVARLHFLLPSLAWSL